jgi:hypothetical protein
LSVLGLAGLEGVGDAEVAGDEDGGGEERHGSAASSRASVTPSPSGNSTSTSTAEGFSWTAASSAAATLPASATTVRPLAASSRPASARNSGSSSTTNTDPVIEPIIAFSPRPQGRESQKRSSKGSVTVHASPSPSARHPPSTSSPSYTRVGIPYPAPPKLRGDFSGRSVCTHPRAAENLLLVQWPAIPSRSLIPLSKEEQ